MKRSAVFIAGLLIITAGCSTLPEPGTASTLTIAPPLNPYQSTTGTPDRPTATSMLSSPQPVLPTPTPFKHIIQSGDTLYGLALRYNISLDRLVSANPGLDSNALTVGTEVIIPFGEEELALPTPTPYSLLQEEPVCYPTTDEGLWCYVLVKNNQSISLESISLAFYFYDADLDLIISQIGYPPLDILQPGQSLPVGVLIPSGPTNQNQITSTLLTAYPSDQAETQVLISDYALEYSQENTIVHINGVFEILSGEKAGDQVWIVGVGFSEGNPVGVRKWISGGDLEEGERYPFEIHLYSLGPQIDRVELYSEIH